MSCQRLNNNDIEKIIANTAATIEIEGLKPYESSINITKEYLKGNIPEDEAITQIKNELNSIIYPVTEETLNNPKCRLDGEVYSYD